MYEVVHLRCGEAVKNNHLKRKLKTSLWVWIANHLSKSPVSKSKHILGIASTGHGASLAYIGSDGIIRSSVLDRWVGIKHTLMFSMDEEHAIRNPSTKIDTEIHQVLSYGYGKFPECRSFEENMPKWFEWLLQDLNVKPSDIDLIITSNSHFATCAARLGPVMNRWFPSAHLFSGIEHHELHQCQAFWQSGFDEAAVLTLDTCGENLKRFAGRKLSGTISVMNSHGERKLLSKLFFPESSAGLIYDSVTHHIGFRLGEEGKTMGLAPYGKKELFDQLKVHLQLYDDGSFRFMDYNDFKAALDNYVKGKEREGEITQRHMNVAYAGQAILELIVTNAFNAALRLSGQKNLVYAGGIALNSVANQIAYRKAKPKRFYIPTNPGDAGHALGCALFGAYELVRRTPPNEELPEYLGPPYSLEEIESVAKSSGFSLLRPDNLDQRIARCIANGHIIARFDGRSEFGPRALGNRSILCDPRRSDIKDYLNTRVKHRETFRPFAPAVLEEHASKWLILEERSSYMLRVVQVREEVRERIPAIVHVDGTARVQTVSLHENPGFWHLIHAFYELTGIPMVLNTSFNVAGKPMVEKPIDALETFSSTEIDVLIMGPFILSKGKLDNYMKNSR